MRGGYAAHIRISGIPIGVVNNLLAPAADERTHAEGHTSARHVDRHAAWGSNGLALTSRHYGLALRMGTARGVDGCFGDFASHDAIVP